MGGYSLSVYFSALVVWGGGVRGLVVVDRYGNESVLLHYAAGFGLRYPYEVHAQLVLPMRKKDKEACRALSRSEFQHNIALIIRGGCQFIEKARNVERAGGVGIIIGDDDPDSGYLIRMLERRGVDDLDGSSVQIPAIFISGKDYANVASRLKQRMTLSAVLNATGSPQDIDKEKGSGFVIPYVAMTVGFVFMVVYSRRKILGGARMSGLYLLSSSIG
ncbi:hypothetical protein AAMO2058_000832000 [Amorphochlora amoebiformis]